MRSLPSGSTGVLLECDDLDEVGRVHALVQAAPPEGVLDLVPAARTLLLVLDPAVTSPERVREEVLSLDHGEHERDRAQEQEPLRIPVTYDGDDLDDVAGLLECQPEEVIRRHTGGLWRVAFCGFAPGFGYLVAQGASGGASRETKETPSWFIPRKDTPRTKVPVGAVGLAGEFTGIYPRASPGGWQLIGRTEMAMFDLDRQPPALLTPGTWVRFVAEDA